MREEVDNRTIFNRLSGNEGDRGVKNSRASLCNCETLLLSAAESVNKRENCDF